ncbi:short-chain dehydrogenase/reductase, partial [Streptomyces sp. NPDC018610]
APAGARAPWRAPAPPPAAPGRGGGGARGGGAPPAGGGGPPRRAAEIIVRTVGREQVPGHLLLGVNAATMALDHSRCRLAEATAWEKVSRSADFDEPYPVELPSEQRP